ncbi:DNA replication protein DnaC [Clostridium vincentii]|uniref:DNA replication protein DnaC n=2 Tax=Clostridium vincentii TaxID=52704 RepID=A0A2T0BEE1_9CLOT|nr:DNA replication protein DnaC [Clostridium vincentii]
MMINGYQSRLLNIYSKIRESETKKLKDRKAEIKNLHPRIIELDNKIQKLSLSLSLAILKSKDDKKTLDTYKDSITEFRAQKYEMLVSNGYPPEFLNLTYQCKKCNDTGFIVNTKCTCYKKKLIQLCYENSLLQDILREKNFNNFDISLFSSHKIGDDKYSPRKNMENTLEYITGDYIPNFATTKTNLLFYGNPGSGKSYLSYCLAKELLDLGYLVVYKTSDEIISDLKDIRFNNNSNLQEILLDCDLLIIDDLGAEQRNEFTVTELFNLLNKKLLRNKRMLVSTNLTLPDITKAYSERMSSRLIGEFRLNKFYSEDIRITLNLKKNRR